MVEVTKANFADEFVNVKQAVDECDFIAIDTEFTALYNAPSSEHAFDTMDERYIKTREQCSNVLIMQFGLCAFKYHPEQKKYTHRDFNFYVFPRPHMKQAPDPRFICQTSTLHFLASNGFDFNKVVNEGIPYLTHAQEKKLRECLANKHQVERNSLSTTKQSTNEQKAVEIPDEHKDFIAEINRRIDAFIADQSETSMDLEPCSGYRRKLIYESVRSKHPTGIELTSKTNEGNQRFISVLKCTDQEMMDNLKSKELNDLEELDATVGFRKVMDCLSESKKPIVGHCMNLDILHMIEQFYFPLPEDLGEYKNVVRMTFPHLLDTKYMCSSEELRPFYELTSLSDIFKLQLQDQSFEHIAIEDEGSGKYYDLKSDKYHEAGYDAFLTGVFFIEMTKKLGSIATPTVEHVDLYSKILSPYVNRFYILRHFDNHCLNIGGPDPEPNRDNVFHVSFPSEWKTTDLVELFLPYGNIYVHWLDDASALVALKNPANAISAKVGLVNKLSRVYCVKPYAEYQKWEMQQFTPAKEVEKRPFQSSEPKLELCKRRKIESTEEMHPVAYTFLSTIGMLACLIIGYFGSLVINYFEVQK